MDGAGSKIERAAWLKEVVDSHTELRGEVPDAGVSVGAVVEDVVGRSPEGGVLVVGPDDTATALHPGDDLAAAGASEVPLEQDRRDRDSGEGSADGVGRGADSGGGAEAALELRRVGLPEGEELHTVFEVAAKDSGTDVRGEDLTGASSEHKELVVGAVIGDTETALREDA